MPGAVRGIDEPGERLRAAEPRGGRELRQRLIPPGAAKRMLHDRQQLDMREAHVGDIGDQPFGKPAPVKRSHRIVAGPHPRGGVDFVDRQRCIGRLPRAALRHPILVSPAIVGRGGDDRTRGGRHLGRARHRVRLLHDAAIGACDLELVHRTDIKARHEQLPHAGAMVAPHRVAATVPAIERPDHRHAPRIGCP